MNLKITVFIWASLCVASSTAWGDISDRKSLIDSLCLMLSLFQIGTFYVFGFVCTAKA